MLQGGIHKALESDVHSVFDGKSHAQLCTLEQQINAKLTSGSVVDAEYWDGLRSKIRVAKARAKIAEIHAEAIKNKQDAIRKIQEKQAAEAAAAAAAADAEEEEQREQQPPARGGSTLIPPPGSRFITPGGAMDAARFKIDLTAPAPSYGVPRLGSVAAAAGVGGGLGARDALGYKTDAELYQAEAQRPMQDGETEFVDEVRVVFSFFCVFLFVLELMLGDWLSCV